MNGKARITRPWKRKLTTRLLCERYGICDRPIDRWTETGVLPKPMVINRIRFWDEEEIEQRDQERMARDTDAEHSNAAA